MGYLELREDKERVLTPEQFHAIRARLASVPPADAGAFSQILKETLDAVDHGYPLDLSLMRSVVRSLQREFLEVIDPSYGPGLAERLAIHEPEPWKRRPLLP